jgi:hypothetical protein
MQQPSNLYHSFETEKKKCNIDNCLSATASIITISCIVAYFIYLAIK